MEQQYLGPFFKRDATNEYEPNKIYMFPRDNALAFIVFDEKKPEEREKKQETKAFLNCEVDEKNKTLIARGMEVEKEFRGKKEFNFGTQLFLKAITYARKNGYTLVTDSSVSEAADKLIQFLISQGYNFVKNPNFKEEEEGSSRRYVTPDDSPLYRLEE